MWTLPAMISGYRDQYMPPLPTSKVSAFSQWCQLAAEQGIFRLHTLCLRTEAKAGSYHYAGISFADTDGFFLLLCNRFHPFAGLAAIAVLPSACQIPEQALTFCDHPLISQHFHLPEFNLLPAEFLNNKIDSEDSISQGAVSNLCNEEFAQFTYWQPKTLGDVVFHYWKLS
jgi:hypothetical protein